jgi:pyruvate,water dikinase
MRCPGEIDITRPRWAEAPSALLPLLLANVKNFPPGAGPAKFAAGRTAAAQKEQELLARLRLLPDGDAKARAVQAQIATLRAFIGYREYPKYALVSRYFLYKQALLREAAILAAAGVIDRPTDIYYLTFDELHAAVRDQVVDRDLIRTRQDEYEHFARLTPPRVLTSDGEMLSGSYQRPDLPPHALPGLGVSRGVVEGRARVLHSLAGADLAAGDILVTTFTDPSWTPLFVAIKGLVTEVGGLMTHGAVIAREYGLPAVVGVQNATRLIPDGHRIRLDGAAGTVELLD